MSYSFEQEKGFIPPTMVGYNIAVEVYKNILSGTQGDLIEIPEEMIDKQKYLSCVGRVVSMGHACFKGDKFTDYADIPVVGNWVVFTPNSGPLISYKGIDMVLTVDTAIKGIVEDPSYVTRD